MLNKMNYILNEQDIITEGTFTPFDESKPFVEVEGRDVVFGLDKVVNGQHIKGDRQEIKRKKAIKLEIAKLKRYLDTEWRWKNERYHAELEEIALGLRMKTTETQQAVFTMRKNVVEKINRLEAQL